MVEGITPVLEREVLEGAGTEVVAVGAFAAALFKGMRANAIDADWSAGTGLEVIGPIEALIFTLAGRFAVLEELQGAGTTILQLRAFGLA